MANNPKRFFGLDIHKEYFVVVGVNADREVVFGPQRVSNYQLDDWVSRVLTLNDAVVLEMITNTYLFYDTLLPQVHSVIAIHPPNVALVTNAQVKTGKKAALALAQLHAAGMLTGVLIPPHKVRDLRALIARREKMVRLSTIAKNRLHLMASRISFTSPRGTAPAKRSSCFPEAPREVERDRARVNSNTRHCNSLGSAFNCSTTFSTIDVFISACSPNLTSISLVFRRHFSGLANLV